MSQSELNLSQPLAPLEWVDSDFWGHVSKCNRFAIQPYTINGKKGFNVWRHGKDGRVIPKLLGAFKTFEEAAAHAEEAKYGGEPKYNKIYDWKSRWDKS